jgi:hypothetical protein
MPRGKRNASVKGGKLDLLSLLSADRRQAVVEEALGSRVRGLFQKHSRATLGKLIEGLTGDEHWGAMQHVRVASVLRPGSSGAAEGAGARRGRPPGRRGKLSAAALDQIIDVVKKKPGLRSEQIQRELDFGQGVVKAGLARLRLERRVRTSGQRRATTYSIA